MILDKYFIKPLFWDYIFCILLSALCYYLVVEKYISIPPKEDAITITSDITNISLTLSGFILTLLTVLITFKSTTTPIKKQDIDKETIFNLFFASGYYFETVKHLKNCIKSLIFIAIIGFSIKLFVPTQFKIQTFYFNIVGLGIIILTITRCLIILSKVLDLQEKEHGNNE